MAKKDWLVNALISLDFFEHNPEYKGEFGHQYFVDNFDISRQSLYRNKTYMKRFQKVKDILKGYKTTNPSSGPAPISGDKEKLDKKKHEVEELEQVIEGLQLRLNECYQILEDHNIDPQFIYPKRLKKHKEA